jgi:RNA-directed DNA polymerase
MPAGNMPDMPTSVRVPYYKKLTVRLSMRKTQMNLPTRGCASATQWDNWHSIQWDTVNHSVKSLQARIVKAVRAKHFHKAKALLHLLSRSFYGKLLSVLRVTTNAGSKTCGVDNQRWNTPLRKWKAVKLLSQKGYKAKPLKRKSIPKKNGKLRHLGIPTMKDRAMQALFKLGLEPIAETTADLNSYGFRPKRSCADAIEQCHNVLGKRTSAVWILEADIKGCFDNISHTWVLEHIPLPKRMLGQWLKAGYIDNKTWFPTESGTPQGGIISPVIANMVLDRLENAILSKACPSRYHNGRWNNPLKVHFVRYADDFIVTCANKDYLENQVKPLIQAFLLERGLELSQEKSNITHINDGFDFLGFNIRKYNGKCLTKPKKDAVKSIYESIREHVKSNPSVPQEALILSILPKIKGWANFYRHVASKRTFAKLDNKVFKLLWNWAKRRHPNKGSHWVKPKYFKHIGNRHWAFMCTNKKQRNIILPRFDATKIIRHTKITSHSNPYDKRWDSYFEQRKKEKQAKRKIISTLSHAN